MITDVSYERRDMNHCGPPMSNQYHYTNSTSSLRKPFSTLNGNVQLSVISEVDTNTLSPINPLSPICPLAKHDCTLAEMSIGDEENQVPVSPVYM